FTPGQFKNPIGVAISSTGVIHVIDTLNGVQQFTQTRASIGALTLSSYGQRILVEETSTEVTLDPSEGWLIHPAIPALSFPLHKYPGAAGIQAIGPITNETNATIHKILGSSTPVTTTNGNRAADVGELVVTTETRDEENALKALLADETPILINLPDDL